MCKDTNRQTDILRDGQRERGTDRRRDSGTDGVQSRKSESEAQLEVFG